MDSTAATVKALYGRCARIHGELEEELSSAFPPDWEAKAERLEELLSDIEALSPSARQTFAKDFGR